MQTNDCENFRNNKISGRYLVHFYSDFPMIKFSGFNYIFPADYRDYEFRTSEQRSMHGFFHYYK